MIKVISHIMRRLAFAVLVFATFSLTPLFSDDPPQPFERIYESFLSNYGIFVSHTTAPSEDSKYYEARVIDEIDYPLLNFFMEILAQEFEKYPPGFVRKVGLRWIFPLRSLRYMQAPVLGLSGNSIIRYNLSYYMQKADNDPFAFDKNDFLKDDIRALIHHEFMHLIDQRFNATWKKDTNWMALQSDDNHFGDGGVSTIKFGAANLTQFNNPQPGFVNLYGMSSPGEDKATLFECFRVPRYAALLEDWQKQDPILADKVANLKKFFKKVDPRFDEEFWIRFQENPEDKKPEARAR